MAQRTLGIALRGCKLGDEVGAELLMHDRCIGRSACSGSTTAGSGSKSASTNAAASSAA